MSLKMKVKVGGITNLSDARYSAGMGVDWLGFPTAALSPTAYKEIINWVSGPELVLEVPPGSPNLEEVRTKYPGHYVQVTVQDLGLIKANSDLQFWVTLKAQDWPQYREAIAQLSNISWLEIQASAEQSEWVAQIQNQRPVIWAFGNDLSIEVAERSGVAGIALQGGHEEKPGLRNYAELADVLEQLEVD